jgi:serralysin
MIRMKISSWLNSLIRRVKRRKPYSTPVGNVRASRAPLSSNSETLEQRTLLTQQSLVAAPIMLIEPGTNPNPPSPFQAPDNQRWSQTFTDGSGLAQGQPTTLRWGIVRDGSTITPQFGGESSNTSSVIQFFDGLFGDGGIADDGDLTQKPWFFVLDDSYDRWGEISGLTFNYFQINDQGTGVFSVPNSQSTSGTTPEILVSGHSIDGQAGSNTLAYNFFPNTGDMVIDTDNTTFFGQMTNNARAARNVATHEVGHGIGFDHVESNDGSFLMEPFASTTFDGPQFDDILAAQRLYGDALEKSGGNDTSGTATVLGTVAATTTVSRGTAASDSSTVVALSAMDFVSVDDEGDTDFYSFTLSQTSNVSLTLTPKGPTYNEGPQGGPSPQPTFNAKNQSDLTLTLFDTNGSTQLANANANGLGGAETITQNSLAAGTYFARITGATTNEIQMYQLDVQNTSSATNTVSADSNSGATGNAAANGTPDTFLIRRNGAMIEVLANGLVAGTFDLTTPIQINGSTDNDTLTLDYSNGDANPTGGISFVGSTGTNTLNVTGAGNLTNVTYLPDTTTNGNGTLTLDGKTATFTGLTPMNVTGVTNFTLTTPNGDDVLTVDSPAAGQNRVSGTSGGVGFEAVTFSTVTNFTIDADANDDGSPADTITFSSDLLATSLGTLTVESAAGSTTTFGSAINSAASVNVTSGTINVNSSLAATGAATVTLNSLGGSINVNQAITTATGLVSVTADDDVIFAAAGDLTSTSGNVTVRADDDAIADPGSGGAVT